MPNIAIPYAAGPGATRRLAEEIARALGQADCSARLIDVEVMFRIDWDALEAADAIVLGAPTVMGGAAAAFRTFMEETADIAARQGWADKIAAGFTVTPAGAAQATLVQLASFAAGHGMVWVGHEPAPGADSALWRDLGLTVAGPADGRGFGDGDMDGAHRFGARIARAARRWSV